jgi:hypothetical protein
MGEQYCIVHRVLSPAIYLDDLDTEWLLIRKTDKTLLEV